MYRFFSSQSRVLPVTLFLIVVNSLIYFVSEFFLNKEIFDAYFGLNSLFFKGFYWQVVTTMFLHGSFMHLAMNMAVLYQFGSILERFLGSTKFGLVYLIGGVLTSILSLSYTYYRLEQGININLVGASGAISVLLGLLAFLDPRVRQGLFVAILLMSFAPLLMGVNVAWYAHLFGFAVGYVYGKVSYR
ncbi:rhomboid family intramembrane serine protease [Campylobacter geochelonis]|uniref:Rhomboid family protein n=1 Tax=Campylobacter geochelonis TaxID=1780362 RepID=A0A128EII0_9BACT|nr:rhomboid family intramembrane serine protease [Campylobacter geochelonis]QKF71298.1 rhomboid family membrane protein [Campylobacter geochelonis]CZE48094.1 rhomboid family protein [Campylobacter geochelonis]CZE48172.1 rhomboid family protein [Campylobacter geochelonis]